jgi:hypothetical protein
MGEQLMTIMLNGSDLTVTQVVAVARQGEAVALAPAAVAAMRQARTVVQEVLGTSEPVYGCRPTLSPSSTWSLGGFSPQRLGLPQPPDSMPSCRAIGGC